MNLKYYLRGLGIGIVVSTLIVGIVAGNRSETLSDEEIRQRARELGMVEESGTLAEEVRKPEQEEAAVQETESPSPDKTPEAEETKSAPSPAAAPSPTAAPTATSAPSPTATPKAEKTETVEEAESVPKDPVKKSEETVTIVVKSGSSSYSVCRQLEEAGLVESAAEYDRYLYGKGYDKRIAAGEHEIPADADKEQIALILSGK